MAVAIYARQSVEKDNSMSLESQIKDCRARLTCEDQKEKIIEFQDAGCTGANTDREAFQKMMRMVEKGNISKIYVFKLDRISRSLYDFLDFLEVLKKYNTKFVCVTDGFDTSTSMGTSIAKILMVFAELERKNIIQRVTQAYNDRSESQFYMGGRRPYGYDLVPIEIGSKKSKKFAVNPLEAEQVKYIFESYAVEGVSLRRLMDNLIQNGIKPITGEWSTAKLSSIIRNPIYVKADNSIYDYFKRHDADIVSEPSKFDGIHGVQMYKMATKDEDGKNIKGAYTVKIIVMQHEGLISADLWLKCQRRITKNKQIGNSLSNATSWLGGKLVCVKCGHTMTCTKGGERADGTRTRYFSCTGKSHKRSCIGIKVPIYADVMEDVVYQLIAEKLATLKQFRKKISTDNSVRINELKNRLSVIEIDQKRAVDLLFGENLNELTIKMVNARAAELDMAAKKLREQIAELENADGEIVNVINLAKKWKTAKFDERKVVCSLFINKIYIHEDGTTEIEWII